MLSTFCFQNVSRCIHSSCFSDEGANAMSISSTIVQQAFGGRTLTASRCGECTTQSERADNFRELQLSIPDQTDNHSVQTLLEYYLQPEKLCGDNQYHCEVCDRLTDGERITMIIEAPPRLILTLKRFRFDPTSQQRTKLLQVVQLDRFITLDKCQYELYAAVVHCGSSVDSGHYYTFAKDQSDWYKFNDSSVIKTSFEDLCKLKPPETPYVLFYSREDVLDPENLPRNVLANHFQHLLKKDQSEYESERDSQTLKLHSIKRNRDDDKQPPGCGGGGFSASNGNMFVC